MPGVVDSRSGAHADPAQPMDVLLGLNATNGRAKVMSGRCDATETSNTCNMYNGIVILKPSTVDVMS